MEFFRTENGCFETGNERNITYGIMGYHRDLVRLYGFFYFVPIFAWCCAQIFFENFIKITDIMKSCIAENALHGIRFRIKALYLNGGGINAVLHQILKRRNADQTAKLAKMNEN